MIAYLMFLIARLALRLRYRIELSGLPDCVSAGRKGILFLPNHPAMIDPVILTALLYRQFRPRALADDKYFRSRFLQYVARQFRVLFVPDIGIAGLAGQDTVNKQLAVCVQSLQKGDNLLFYPSGRLYHSQREKLRGMGGLRTILDLYPEARIVLVRTSGLWGSDFSWAKGYQNSFAETLFRHLKHILLNGIFFSPRRTVKVELVASPEDFPRQAEKETLNRYLETFYNATATPNTYVPYTWFEPAGVRILPEPEVFVRHEDTSGVPNSTRQSVYAKLREITGRATFNDTDTLGTDLGMDSLGIAELHYWLQETFGYEGGNPAALKSVASLLRTAIGETVATEPLQAIPALWFVPENPAPLLEMQKSPAYTMVGRKLTDIFLANAKKNPNRPLIADQLRGVMRNRDVVLAILALKDSIQRLPGDRIGILMPACNVVTVLYFSCLFAGKTPVLVNWTSGIRNMEYCLETVKLQHILTARTVIERLEERGIEFGTLLPTFIYLEDVAKKITLPHKLLAKFRSYFSWQTLRKAAVPEIAAILFTSGSETRPKAVPLTHENLRSDMAATLQFIHLRQDDCMLGMLPPFHSLGLMINLLLPPCAGLRMAYHANPTEGEMLARMIATYKITMLGGTPTFIGNIMRNATHSQVATVRLMAIGAETTPAAIQALIEERCPKAVILNGYGITECGPIVAFTRPEATYFGTIGEPLIGLDWAIVDEDCQHRLPADKTGMLLVRGPNVFSGYINYDGPSPFVQFEGQEWYRTGDLISINQDGFFVFKGRLKRFVKIGGEMISLPAMEEILLNAYPGGSEQDGPMLAVESLGEDDQNPEITLFTTIELERESVNQTLRKAGLAPSNAVKNVVQLEKIPLLGSGKTDYRSLKTFILS